MNQFKAWKCRVKIMINNIDIKKMGAYVFVKLFLRKTCIQTLKPKCFLIIEE